MSNTRRNRLGSDVSGGDGPGMIVEETKEESKEVKIGRIDATALSRSDQLKHSQTVNFAKQQQDSADSKKLLGINNSSNTSVRQQSHRSSMIETSNVHVGSQDSKFAQMFYEGMKNFRIRQFAKDRAHSEFGLLDPSLLNGKYVVYKVTGTDSSGSFEGNRRYNEFFLLR